MVRGERPEAPGRLIFEEMLETPEFAELVAPLGEPQRLRVERPRVVEHLGGVQRPGSGGDWKIRIHLFFDQGSITARPGDRGAWIAEEKGLATPEALAGREIEERETAERARIEQEAAERARIEQEAAEKSRRLREAAERERRERAAAKSAPPTPPPPPEAVEASEVATPEPAIEPEPIALRPSPEQIDDCPIEPWREDCRELCAPGASWEWCGYRE